METRLPRDWRDDRIEELELQLEKAFRRIKELEAQLEKALKRIDVLERQLGLNSQNSSRPPSSDSEKARVKRRRRKPSARQAGGQPGHESHCRSLLPEQEVDRFHTYFPSNCMTCGLELSSFDQLEKPERRQVFELVEKPVECIEHQFFACQCPGCGESTRADIPVEIAISGWGPRLTALTGVLLSVCHNTRRITDWFVQNVLGAPGSLGTVQRHLREVSRALEPGFEQIKFAETHEETVGLDETGWRLGRVPHWIWVAVSSKQALYIIREKRSKAVARELVGEPGGRIFITDRYGAYSFLPKSQHQICHAHLLRDFHQMAASRDGPLAEIGTKLEEISRNFQAEWARVKAGHRDRSDFIAWMMEKVRPDWERLLLQADARGKKAPAVVRWLLKTENRELAWTFLRYKGAEPTNNASERALRGLVIQRKLSWGSQSDEGLRLIERLWTVTESCKRQNQNVLEYLTQAVLAYRTGEPAPILAPAYPA